MRTCELRIRTSSAWTASCTRHGTAAALHSARTALRVPPESQEANALPSTVSKAANELNATGLLAVRTCVAAAEAESRVPVELCPLEQAEVHQRVQQLVVAPPPVLR